MWWMWFASHPMSFPSGGSGSNKGQFIWQLLQQCQTSAGAEPTVCYHYIDVEKLIVDNISKRIKKLTSDKPNITITSSNDEHSLEPSEERYLSDVSIKSGSIDDLKTKLLLYANVVTNNWVLSLITKEIDKNSIDHKERLFIVNLIPNRINLFRNCLYLRQAPSFVNFHFNYVAINLVKSNSKRKDLDQLAANSGYDEVNGNFINYFRLINKLIEVKAEENPVKIRIKLTKNSKNAIKISTKEDLLSFIYTPKRDGMEIDITSFDLNCSIFSEPTSKTSQNGLLFMIKNEIEVEDNQVIFFDDNDYKTSVVKQFAIAYFSAKTELGCDRRDSNKWMSSNLLIISVLSHNQTFRTIVTNQCNR